MCRFWKTRAAKVARIDSLDIPYSRQLAEAVQEAAIDRAAKVSGTKRLCQAEFTESLFALYCLVFYLIVCVLMSPASLRAHSKGRERLIILRAALASALLLSGGLANATVLQYDRDGTVTVMDEARQRAAPGYPPATRAGDRAGGRYEGLARLVGRGYGASREIEAIGLDADAFEDLFAALISVESAFDPRAVSHAGAMGLGQLMPETAQRLGVADPFDPLENLDGAARYLIAQLGRFGRVDHALAAYNAGPERVATHRGIPPIQETRQFVRLVSARAGLSGAVQASSAEAGDQETIAQQDEELSVWQF